MNHSEVCDNLGTIAKSGSQEFMNNLKDGEQSSADSIIGQFGVGFYSSFIVADSVEVFTKNGKGDKGVRWVSDGSGEYSVSEASNLGFERGTKLVLRLKPECREFVEEKTIESILKKYSLFISYPIKLNGNTINNL